MQSVLDRARKALLDYQSPLLCGAGFDRDKYGVYFLIREKGTASYLCDYWYTGKEGVQLHLWRRQNESKKVKLSQV